MAATCDGFVQYLDRSTHQRWAAALLVYTDTAGFEMWRRFAPRGRAALAVLQDMDATQEDALMRTNLVTLHEPHGPRLFAELKANPRVDVRAYLVAVGRTSYTTGFTLHSNGRHLATVETVMVATDAATHTRPEPLRHAESLRDLVSEMPARCERVTFVPPGADAAVWSSAVRTTDCDNYQVLCAHQPSVCAPPPRRQEGSALLTAMYLCAVTAYQQRSLPATVRGGSCGLPRKRSLCWTGGRARATPCDRRERELHWASPRVRSD